MTLVMVKGNGNGSSSGNDSGTSNGSGKGGGNLVMQVMVTMPSDGYSTAMLHSVLQISYLCFIV